MRILLTTDYYPPHKGGTEVVVRHLAEQLASRGHEVLVATLNTGAERPADRINGVEIVRVVSRDMTQRLGLQMAVSWAWRGAIARCIREFRPDAVNAHNLFFFTTPWAIAAARRARVPTIVTVHLNSAASLGGLAGVLAAGYEATAGRRMLLSASHVVFVGESVAKHFSHVIPSHRSSVIHNGVDAARFAPPEAREGPPTVLFVGRLIRNKGPDVFVKAAGLISSLRPDVRFILVGDGPMRSILAKEACRLPSVELVGERSDVEQFMKRSGVFVRPSTLEGLPLTILEAMASGLPVVASDIPGNQDLVLEGENGLLVPAGDVRATAQAILRLIDDELLRSRMGTAGRARVLAEFTWEEAARRYETLLEGLKD